MKNRILNVVLVVFLGVSFWLAATADGGSGWAKHHELTLAAPTLSVNGSETFGSQITFDAVADPTPSPANPAVDAVQWVWLSCSQGGSQVDSETHLVQGGVSGPYTLGPTGLWVGGDADCTAAFGYGPEVDPAFYFTTLDFHVTG